MGVAWLISTVNIRDQWHLQNHFLVLFNVLLLRGPEITPDWAVEPTLELSTHCKATLSMLFDLLFLWVLNNYCGALPMLSLHAHPGLVWFSLFPTKAISQALGRELLGGQVRLLRTLVRCWETMFGEHAESPLQEYASNYNSRSLAKF